MAIYFIDRFTPVIGDHAYVEADTPDAALAALAREFARRDLEIDFEPQTAWRVTDMQRPLCVIEWRD